MVGHDIDDDLEISPMCFGHQSMQVVFAAVVRVDAIVVSDRVGAAECSLLLQLTYGMDGHQPQNIDAEGLQVIEPGFDAVEIACYREGAGIDFVDDAVSQPVRTRPGSFAPHVFGRRGEDSESPGPQHEDDKQQAAPRM